jgi:hypothetical protein
VSFYSVLASSVLVLHLVFILWVVLGAFFTNSRVVLRWLHVASLVWALLVEILPWSCPLTVLENWLEQRAGVQPYQGGFLLHYLDRIVYPDIDPAWLAAGGIAVCLCNSAWYARRACLERGQRFDQA